MTLSLVEDTAPLGQYNGETVIASTTVLNVNTVFSGLSLGVTAGQSRNFLLLAGFTTLGRHYFQTTFHLIQALSPTANLADFRQYQVNFSPAPMVFMSFDQGVDTLPVSQAGATNIVLGSFDLRLVKNQQPRTLTELTFDLASAGAVSAADLANMRLYQDRGNHRRAGCLRCAAGHSGRSDLRQRDHRPFDPSVTGRRLLPGGG